MKYTAALLATSVGLATAVHSPEKQWQPRDWHPKPYEPKPHPPPPPKYDPHPPPPPPPKHPKPTKGCPSAPTKTVTVTETISGGLTSTSYPTSYPEPSGLPPVDSQALQDSITAENLAEKAQELEDLAYTSDPRNRVMGSEGHNKTIDWLVENIEALGDYYSVYTQPFTALYANSEGNLTVNDVEQTIDLFEYSAGGSETAALVPIANLGCEASDYPAEVSGNIALVSRGSCEFGLKSALAGSAGAIAAIIYNNAPGAVGGGTLGAPPRPEGEYVPTVGVSQENGASFIESIEAGETVTAVIKVDSDIYNITTYNVIADSVGGNPNATIMIGAHSDSVVAGPGINDDGSGVVGILEVAEQLTAYSTNNSVRIAFWSGEEFGLLGSNYYTSQLDPAEAANIRLYLNFDMIASPNYIYAIYDGDGSAFNLSGPPGSAEAEYFFEDWFASQGLASVPTEFNGRSDYGGFLDIGVAAGGLFTGAEGIKTEEEASLFGGEAGVDYDINYHQAGDNFTNLNFEAFEVNTKAIAAAVAEYAASFDSLPAPNVTTLAKRKRSAETWKATPKRSAGSCGSRTHSHALL